MKARVRFYGSVWTAQRCARHQHLELVGNDAAAYMAAAGAVQAGAARAAIIVTDYAFTRFSPDPDSSDRWARTRRRERRLPAGAAS